MCCFTILLCLISLAAAHVHFSTSNFAASFAQDSGVLKSLRPSSDPSFDFSPSDVFHFRNGRRQYHTGDLTLQYRVDGRSEWTTANTAVSRPLIMTPSSVRSGTVISDLNEALQNATGTLDVTRIWKDLLGDLALSFTIQNIAAGVVELGGLGIPIEFNNIFTNRTATETTAKCVFVDPFIGLNAGYLQVTRLTGTGPNLILTPLNKASKFEAWRFLHEPDDLQLGYQTQTFEGNYAWNIFTKSLAESEWKGVEPWNPPTSAMLAPRDSITVGLRFSLAKQVQNIEATVAKTTPIAVGIPGYILPHDLKGRLFIKSEYDVATITAHPANSLQITACGSYSANWTGFNVNADSKAFGRARLDIVYTDGSIHTVHYWIAHSSPIALSQFGKFLTTQQWFTNTSDPFGRAPSVITYDRSTNDYVTQDNRTWLAGLSDEGGAGSFLAAGMKQSVRPEMTEVAKVEHMVDDVVWGWLQISSGNETYAVRKSLFFYQPNLVPGYDYDPYFNWKINPDETWNKSLAYLIDRTYDYVHVSAVYWSLYRAGRTHPGILTHHSKEWYLLQAYETVKYAVSNSSVGTPLTGYWNVGLMGETVWGFLLDDLCAEQYTAEASHMRTLMKARQELWASTPDPFGSEMAWDSTGEEGVYYWARYFGDRATANKAVNAIRGYMPTIAHWGWNGNPRRYWDFLYAGQMQLARYERHIHHYGSGLNALPMLDWYRRSHNSQTLESIYDLRVGYGGNQGPLSNVDAGGFGSMAFHSYPDTLRWDAYSGDYGPNFLGLVIAAATYLVNHPIFGNVEVIGGGKLIRVEPRDAVRKRIFIAEVSLWIEFDAGEINEFTFDTHSYEVSVRIIGDSGVSTMKWEQTTTPLSGRKMMLATEGLEHRLGSYLVPLPVTVKFVIA